MSKKTPELEEIDNLTQNLLIRIKPENKIKLFNYAFENNTTVSALVRDLVTETINK